MAVVTVDELQAYMAGLKMKAVEKNAAALILDGVQGELETYLYRAIEPRHVREVAICDFRGVVILSRTPVSRILKVSSVASNTALPLGVFDPGSVPEIPDIQTHDYVPTGDGLELLAAGGIDVGGAEGTRWIVEYIAGGGTFMSTAMPQMKLAILRVAAREAQQMFDDTRGLRDTTQSEPVDPLPVPHKGWLDDELARFSRYKRRVVAT